MEEFIFDLQRFATTWTLTYDSTNGSTPYKLTATGKQDISKDTLTNLFADSGVAAGDTIKLGGNVETTTIVAVTKSLTINLNGKTLKRTTSDPGNTTLYVNAAGITVTVTDTSGGQIVIDSNANSTRPIAIDSGGNLILEKGTLTGGELGVSLTNGTFTMNGGTIEAAGRAGKHYSAVEVGKSSTFTMNDGTIKAEAGSGVDEVSGVYVMGNASFTMNKGTITATTFAVSSNGTNSDDNKAAKITVNGGTITSTSNDGAGIYAPSIDGVTKITGGTISGPTGIEIRAGSLDISGKNTKITSTATDGLIYKANGNGSTTTGAGIAVAQHTTEQEITVKVKEATVSGYTAISVTNPQDSTAEKYPDVKLESGTFISTSKNTADRSVSKQTVKDNSNKDVDEITVTGNDVIYKTDARVTLNVTGGTFKNNSKTGTLTATGGTVKIGDYTINVIPDGDTTTPNKSNITVLGGSASTLADKSIGTFTIDTKGNPTGFIFAEAQLGHKIVLPSGFDLSSFKLYDVDTKTEISIPTFSGTGAVAIGQDTTAGQYFLIVDKNAGTLTLNKKTLDVSSLASKDYAKITFDSTGFVSVLPINNSSASIASVVDAAKETTTDSNFLSGSAITVTGDAATSDANGIVFTTDGNNIATKTGNYTYSYKDGAATLTLTSADETLYNTGDATKVILGGKEGTITDNSGNEFDYVSGGKAYFTATSGNLASFVFMSKNDALTLPQDSGLALGYTLNNAVTTLTPPTVTNTTEYTIEMLKTSGDFELSGLGAGATATVNGAEFTFSDADGTILFTTTDGTTLTAQGLTATGGTVTMNQTAAELLDESFTINGTKLNITASSTLLDNALIYNMSDNSLLGLGTGSAIVDAGTITKIYVNGTDATYTFGADSKAIEFTVTANGTDAEDLAYFTLASGKPSGFTFMATDDAIAIPATNLPSGFLLYDGEGEGFTAPTVWATESKSAKDGYTVVKGETNFTIEGLNTNNYIEFDTAKLTILGGDEVAIAFNKSGELVGINGVASTGDGVKVSGATKAIQFNEEDFVEITGTTASFVYEVTESGTQISEVYAGSTIKQVADATKIKTTSGTKGAGTFTFGAASTVYTVAQQSSDDGIIFELDGVTVNGISGVDGNESVTGALADLATLNESAFKVESKTAGTQYTFSGTKFDGLLDGDKVVTAGALTDFVAQGDGEFTIINAPMNIAGDKNGVTFKVSNEALSAIENLDKDATATGLFDGGVTVNGKAIEIVGDENVIVTGATNAVAKVGGLSGEVKIAQAEDVTQFGATGDGTFAFEFAGDEVFTLTGNAEIETVFELTSEKISAIKGLDSAEEIGGNFENGIKVDGSAIQVTNDEFITVSKNSDGLTVGEFASGASLAQATGVTLVKTEAISDGDSFTLGDKKFTFTGADEDGVEFKLSSGQVVGINDIDSEAISGALNGISLNENTAIQINQNENYTYNFANKEISGVVDGNKIVNVNGASSVFVGGESFTVEFANGKISATGAGEGVKFLVESPNTAVEVAELATGATLSGAIGTLEKINGAEFDITDKTGFAVVGKDDGISEIIELSGGAVVKNAGGADKASTNTDGEFTFGEQIFEIGDDEKVTFGLAENSVTAIDELNGFVTGNFDGLTVNAKTIEISGDTDNEFTLYGTENADGIAEISGVGGSSVAINAVGGASVIYTSAAGKYTFASGQEFATDDDALKFDVTTAVAVEKISQLEKTITGKFDDIKAVNGASFAVKDNDGILKVIGKADGISEIADVDGGATIDNAGGAELISTKTDGKFTFTEQEFEISGDSSISFKMDTTQAAKVVGIKNFDEKPAMIRGELAAIEIDGVGNIDVTGDADGILSYAVDADGARILSEVGGASVAINAVGGAEKVEVITAGNYKFPTQNYELGAQSATFGLNGTTVNLIENLNGDVTGNFTTKDFTVNGKKLQIDVANAIKVSGGASGIELISGLVDGAKILEAEGVKIATTAEDGTFTFKDGREITIAGDSQVTFELDGDGNLVSIGDLENTATVSGNLNGLGFGGASSVINVQADDLVLTYFNGTLSGVVPAHTVLSADGATMVAAAGNGSYQFGSGSTAQVFEISGDEGIIGFRMATENVVDAITELDAGAEIVGELNGLTINNGAAIDVVGDTNFGAVAGENGLQALTDLGGDVTVNNADGAKILQTNADGTFKILESAPLEITNDGNGVIFGVENNLVNSVSDVNGAVVGNFDGNILVNGEAIQVKDDADGIAVYGDGSKVTKISDVNAGATIVDWGSATEILTKGAGQFTFGGDSATGQLFANTGDELFIFNTSASGVTGVDAFENGTLTFDTNTSALAVNNAQLKFNTTSDVTLTIENSLVVGVAGVTGSVSGLGTATVDATGPINVNGKELDITDADSSFKVEVADGEVTKATGVTGAATVNVESGAFETDELGAFNIGGEEFTFTDVDGQAAFTTNENKLLTAVDALIGTVIDSDGGGEFRLNGDLIGYNSNTAVTIATDGSDITSVEGLANGAAVYGALDNTSLKIVGTSSTLPAYASELSVNGNRYALIGDADGVTLNGANQVIGLDGNASLKVGEAGNYTVNGNAFSELETDDVIVGTSDGGAYLYDPNNIIVTKDTPIEEIETMLGLPEYENQAGSEETPLDSAGLSSILEDLDQPLEIYATNDSTEPQVMDYSNNRFTKKVHMFAGRQTVKFNDDGQNTAQVVAGATGEKTIEFGGHGDTAVLDMENGVGNRINISSGGGDDNIFVRGSAPVTFEMSAGGLDMITTFAGANSRIHLESYDPETGSGIKIDEATVQDISAAIASGFLSFTDGALYIGDPNSQNYAKVYFEGQDSATGSVMVNLYSQGNVKQLVGFTNSGGGEIDASNSAEDVILIGNSDGNKRGGSVLKGGTGNDQAFAGGGDDVDLGEGLNEVTLHNDENRSGANISVRRGMTTINNFNSTFNRQHGDCLDADLSNSRAHFNGKDLIIENGNGSYGILANVKPNGAISYDLASSSDAEFSNLIVDDNYVNVLIGSGEDVVKTAIGAAGSVMQVESDESKRAEHYIGENSGVTFAGYTGEAIVDLSQEWTSSIDGQLAVFEGITSLKAGAAQSRNAFKGSSNSETLMAGQGYASLYGDGGNNLLVGYNGIDGEKEGYTTFMVLGHADGAANTISGFEFVSDDNYTDTDKVTADRLEVDLNTNHFDSVEISGADVVITVKNNNSNATESVIVQNAVGKDIRINNTTNGGNIVAQVNTDALTFDKYATYYKAEGKNATLNVDSGLDTAVVWLDGSKGKEFVGDFAVIDARNSSAKAELAGNTRDNTIYAGSGETSLWGGSRGDDVMYGGSGKDTFYYAYGNGTDIVNGAGNGDVVNLAGMSLDQLASTEFGDNAIAITFRDGGKLTVNDGGAEVAYMLQGDTYYADRENKSWSKKA